MIKKTIYRSFLLALLLLLTAAYLFWHRQWIPYAYDQAKGQLSIVFEAQPIEEYAANTAIPDSVKEAIDLIRQVKHYTVDSLGLKPSGSFEHIYDQKGEPLMWLVTACLPFQLTSYQWDYPIVGRMSYRGFFKKESALSEEIRLKEEGFDTRIRTVGAWSTLGFLNDPILSNMLYESKGDIVNTVIHELTHSTVFIWGETSLNENMASFVGDEGTKQFLRAYFGENSPEYQDYTYHDGDAEKFTQYMLSSAKALDSLYTSLSTEISAAQKTAKKNELIELICQNLDTISFSNLRYKSIFKKAKPNNAYFMGFLRYREHQNEFRKEFEERFNGNLRAYISYLKEKY